MHFGMMLASSWNHSGIILRNVGFVLGPLGTIVGHLSNKLLHGRPMYRILMNFRFASGPSGAPLFHHWGPYFLSWGLAWWKFGI